MALLCLEDAVAAAPGALHGPWSHNIILWGYNEYQWDIQPQNSLCIYVSIWKFRLNQNFEWPIIIFRITNCIFRVYFRQNHRVVGQNLAHLIITFWWLQDRIVIEVSTTLWILINLKIHSYIFSLLVIQTFKLCQDPKAVMEAGCTDRFTSFPGVVGMWTSDD